MGRSHRTAAFNGGIGSRVRRVGSGLDVRDFFDLCFMLDLLVQDIVKEGKTRWFEVFVRKQSNTCLKVL